MDNQHDSPDHSPGHPETSRASAASTDKNQERWWWTGTLRAVLGAAIVAYQWTAISSGEAVVPNWLMVAVGAAISVWGLRTVWAAYQERQSDGTAP